MALNLLAKRHSNSLYESFFDLIFCCLITFIVLVLALITSIEDRVDSMKDEAVAVIKERLDLQSKEKQLELSMRHKDESISTRQAQIDSLHRQQVELLASTEAITAELRQKEQVLTASQNQLDKMIGTRRFSGGQGTAGLSLMWDSLGSRTRIWPVPQAHDAFNTDHGDPALNRLAKKRCREDARRIVETLKPLSIKDISDILNSISAYTVTITESRPKLGVDLAMSSRGLEVASSPEQSSWRMSGGQVGDIILDINNIELAGTEKERLATIVSTFEWLRFGDKVRLKVKTKDGETVVREVTLVRSNYPTLQYVNLSSFPALNLVAQDLVDVEGELKGDATTATILTISKSTRELIDKISAKVDHKTKEPVSEENSPVMRVNIDDRDHRLIVGGVVFSAPEFLNLLTAFYGSPVVLDFGDTPVPDWVVTEILIPSGFVNKSPLPIRIK